MLPAVLRRPREERPRRTAAVAYRGLLLLGDLGHGEVVVAVERDERGYRATIVFDDVEMPAVAKSNSVDRETASAPGTILHGGQNWEYNMSYLGLGWDQGMFGYTLGKQLRTHAVFCAAPKPRFRCTSSNEMAAGVIPEMRAACPSVSGRC